ncbi:MAG: hypothetical protein JXR51_05975 [Bacteroidales bacterium]|nr:hypothetical protein [Bacteroidales bacterium]MBN2756708.1 hypothetical protein [Bacteroidales bacterium]
MKKLSRLTLFSLIIFLYSSQALFLKAQTDLEAGKGYFFTSFKPDGFKKEVNVGNELYVRMNLGKTMFELAQEKGLESSFTAYGFVTVYINGNKAFTSNQLSFASNYSKVWTSFDIPLNINPDFIAKISSDQSMLETSQNIWVFQQLFQEKSIPKMYAASAMTSMTSGKYEVKVDFGLGNSSSSEPVATVCSGTVSVIVDEAGSEEIALNGPKHLRPLKADEKGKFVFSSQSFTPGKDKLTVNLELPQSPKYYNIKWCKANTCDYDHGSLLFYASLDGKFLASWSTVFWGADYDSKKDFDMVILPLTDAGYENSDAPFNKSILHKSAENPVVYALLDMLYGGQLLVGNHKLTIKTYSGECVPYDVSFENSHNYFIKWPSIAENTVDINVTQEGLTKLSNSSSAKKLTHAAGEWVAVDKALFAENSKNPDFQLIDISTTSQWKITKNSLGVILYRECRADVIYKSKFGYRFTENLVIKEDYSGGGKYTSPHLVSGIGVLITPAELSSMHRPVPGIKVK